jgi:hypothetical protein
MNKKTGLYIGIGLVAVSIIGIAIYYFVKKKGGGEGEGEEGKEEQQPPPDLNNPTSLVGRRVQAASGMVNLRSTPAVDNGSSVMGITLPFGDNLVGQRGGEFGKIIAITQGDGGYTYFKVLLDDTTDVEGGLKEVYVREDVVRVV